MNCDQVIGFETAIKGGWEGRGFGRKYIKTYKCPKCGSEHRLIVSGRRGKRPDQGPGAFSCGRTLS